MLRPTIERPLVGGLIGIKWVCHRVPMIEFDSTSESAGRTNMDILISIAEWLAMAAGGAILFGAVVVGLLVWLLNRPVD
jgi:hypothetical protein